MDEKPTRLDKEYPQGNPDAKDCRGCGLTKIEHSGARICPECDGPAYMQKEIPQQ